MFSLHFNGGESAVSIRQYNFEASEPVAKEVVRAVNEMIDKDGRFPAQKTDKQRRQSSMY